MSNLKHILLLIVILNLSKNRQCFAQKFADKEYYLIDSLVLENLTEDDVFLLDSCLEIYHNTTIDTTKVKALDCLTNYIYDEITWKKYNWLVYDFIKKNSKQSLNKAQPKFYKKLHATSSRNLGDIYESKGDIIKALSYYQQSLIKLEELNDHHGESEILNLIGGVYERLGDVSKSLDYRHRSLKIREKLGDKLGIAHCLNNIAGLYSSQGDIPKALNYYHQSLIIDKELGNTSGIAMSYNNIGAMYNKRPNRDIPKALDYHRKSLKIRKEIGDKVGIAMSLNNIGAAYKDLDDFSEAINYYHQSLKILEEIMFQEGILRSLNNIGNVELKQGEIKKAKVTLQKAFLLANELGYPDIISVSAEYLSQIAIKQNNYKDAYDMYQLHITMRDSINNQSTQKTTTQQQAKYKYEKQKTIDDVESEKLIAIEKEEKEKQKILTIATSLGLGFVVLFLFFVFNRLQVTKKQKLVIEEQKEIVELAHKETEHQKEIIEGAHKEITDSINYAERIQRSFLATKEMLDTNLKDYFVYFNPKDIVSGDFYWAGHLQNGNFAVVNADSTGHGVPGAIMSILNISSIEKAIEQGENEPAEIFNKTRKTIIERLEKDGSKEGGKDGMDASIICFDFKNSKFTYTAANNPIWVIRKNELTIIKPDKIPVGKHDNDSISFSQGEFEFEKGDQIYTLTDGFQDQFGGPKGKKFMVKKMREYIMSICHIPMKEQHKKLNEAFTSWRGEHEQVDDVCVIGVRI